MIPSREEMRRELDRRHGKVLQDRFADASVAICGLGGLGSNVATALARAGVGHLHLIDFDRVDISNLNRQQYMAHQPGVFKTEALKENLLMIAPYVKVTVDTVRITEENIRRLLRNDDIICEAFDVAEAKAMLANFILENMPEKYLVSGSGMAWILSSNTIRTMKVTEKFYLCGDEISDADKGDGLFSSRVMICAAHQANMIMRIIAGKYDV